MNEPSLAAVLEAALLSALSWWACRDAARLPVLRMPLAIFAGSYIVTTAIGAAIIGFFGAEVLPVTWGMDLSYVREMGASYWVLLFMPLILPPAIAAWLLRRDGDQATAPPPPLPAVAAELSPLAILIPLLAFSAYCAYALVASGYGSTLADISSISGDFYALMVLRGEMMSSLGNAFFGLVYTALPTLCHCALYLAATRPKPAHWALFLFALAVTALFSLAVVQKTLILLLLFFTAVAAAELRLVSGRIFALAGVAGMALLGALQLVFQGGEWTMLDSMALVIFRLSSSFPYYVNLYPDVLPYGGVDLGLNVIGLGEVPRDQLDVFQLAYPSVTIEDGAAPAAAQMRAYSQAGLPWALITTLGIGVVIYLVGRSRRRVTGPLSFVFQIQLLRVLYYLTQTSTTETITSSYGLIWVLLALGSVAGTQSLLSSRGGSQPASGHASLPGGG